VSHDLSRKHFVAKGLGLLALAGLAPKLRAFSASGSAAKADALVAAKSATDGRVSALRSGTAAHRLAAAARSHAAPQVRVEPRAVARSDFAPSAPTSTAASFRN